MSEQPLSNTTLHVRVFNAITRICSSAPPESYLGKLLVSQRTKLTAAAILAMGNVDCTVAGVKSEERAPDGEVRPLPARSEISVSCVTNLQAQQALAALTGYLEALEPGEIVTGQFVHRLTNHYLPRLKESLAMQYPVSPLKPVSGYPTVIDALSKLVILKEHKDKHGKDAYYEFEQPIAWRMAKDALEAVGVKYVG